MDDFTDKVPWIAPFVGGLLDYWHQVQTGQRKPTLWSFVLHVGMAMFFGWICGLCAKGGGWGYEWSLAAAGLGGFLGVRLADLLYFWLSKRAGV